MSNNFIDNSIILGACIGGGCALIFGNSAGAVVPFVVFGGLAGGLACAVVLGAFVVVYCIYQAYECVKEFVSCFARSIPTPIPTSSQTESQTSQTKSIKIIKKTHDKIKQLLQENYDEQSRFCRVSKIILMQGSDSFLIKSKPLLDLIEDNNLIKTTENIKNFCTEHEFDEAIITYLVVQAAMNVSLITDENALQNIHSQYCEDPLGYFQIVFQGQSNLIPTESKPIDDFPILCPMFPCLQVPFPGPEIITL